MEGKTSHDYNAGERPQQDQQQTLPQSHYPQQLFYQPTVHISQQHRQQQRQQHEPQLQQHHTCAVNIIDNNNVTSSPAHMHTFLAGSGLMSSSSKRPQQGSQQSLSYQVPDPPNSVGQVRHATTHTTTHMDQQTLRSTSHLAPMDQLASTELKHELAANTQYGFSTSQVSSGRPSHGPSTDNQTLRAYDQTGIRSGQQVTEQTSNGLQQDSSRMQESVVSKDTRQTKAANSENTVVVLFSGTINDITKHLGNDGQSEGSATDLMIETKDAPEPLSTSSDQVLATYQSCCQERKTRQPEKELADGMAQGSDLESNSDRANTRIANRSTDVHHNRPVAITGNRTINIPEIRTLVQRRSNVKPAKTQREEGLKVQSSEQEDEDGWVDEDLESDEGDMEMEQDDVLPIPEGFWYKFSSSSDGKRAIAGVNAVEEIPAGKQFGPLTGQLVGEQEGCLSQSSWELCTKGNIVLYIDGGCDWLSYIQCAQRKAEQNMEAIQLYGDIYFRTTKFIEPGSELRVFYSQEYSAHVGFKTDLRQLTFQSDMKAFSCSECECHYTNPKLLLRHIKLSHQHKHSNDLRHVVTLETRSQTVEREQTLTKALKEMENKYQSRNHPIKVIANHAEPSRRYSSDLGPVDTRKTQSQTSQSKESVRKSVRDLGKNVQHRNLPLKPKGKPRPKLHSEPSRKLVCLTCGKTFTTEGRLQAHNMFHAFTSEYDCPICGEAQASGYMLERHIAGHRTRTYQCQQCPRTYLSQHALYCHEQNIHTNKKTKYYSCSMCPVKFRWKRQMKEHEKEHETERNEGKDSESEDLIQEPDNPESRTAHKRKLKKPSRVVQNLDVIVDEENGDTSIKDMLGKKLDYFKDPSLRFKCMYCPKRYSSDNRVRTHQREVHEDRGRYKCSHCPKQFVCRSRFDIHQQRHTTTDKLYKCTDCPSSFASQSALKNHYGEHTGLKPFKCHICNKGFGKKELVKAHIGRIHSVVELKFPCSFCNKRFAHKWDLTKHERRHKGIRAFKCDICGKGFTAKHSLQLHVRGVHEKLKPYQCEICGKRSSTNHHHNIHLLMHKKKGQDKPIAAENQPSFDDMVKDYL